MKKQHSEKHFITCIRKQNNIFCLLKIILIKFLNLLNSLRFTILIIHIYFKWKSRILDKYDEYLKNRWNEINSYKNVDFKCIRRHFHVT